MSSPRIIFFDLETLPNLKEAMKVWPGLGNFPGLTLKASINTIICFGWKALGDDSAKCLNVWDVDGDLNDDRALCAAAYEILKDADCVVTHNGKRFDWRFLQTRLLYHGLPPLAKIPHIDTCQEAKRNLYIFNNRLNVIARFLTEKEKKEHEGWDLWVKVSERDPVAMKTMSEYCAQDVEVLESVFRSLRPYMTGLPNHNMFTAGEQHLCPNCGSSRLVKHGRRMTKTTSYQRYRCQDCRATSRTDKRDKLPRSI